MRSKGALLKLNRSFFVALFKRLVAHLNRLNLDELLARIERLREPQQRQIFDRLSVFLSVCA
jgi:hypothetical protein